MPWPTAGQYVFDNSRSLVKVFTYKVPNLMSAIAHDLELHGSLLEGTVTVDEETARVEALVELWNLQVRDGILGSMQKSECEKLLRKKILQSKDKAWARFSGRATRGDSPKVAGDLSLMGSRTKKVELACTLTTLEAGSLAVSLRHELLQTDYGMKPFKAMMGMLQLQDRVVVEIEAVLKPK